MTNLNEHAAENICKILLANKLDLEEKRVVTKEEGAKLAKSSNIKFFECSARSNQNVMESFLEITNDIMKTHDTSVNPKPAETKPVKKCCK